MKTHKFHYVMDKEIAFFQGFGEENYVVAMCGRCSLNVNLPEYFTDEPKKVTCKRCLKHKNFKMIEFFEKLANKKE